MSDTKVFCSQCSAVVEREDIRTGAAIATKSVAFCPKCAKALTDDERTALIPASRASADSAGTKTSPGPDSMAIRNVVAKRLKHQDSSVSWLAIGIGIGIAVFVTLLLLALRAAGPAAEAPDTPAHSTPAPNE